MTGLLIRHAATLWNEQQLWQGAEVDPPLSEKGRLSATRMRSVIPEFVLKPGTISVSSPMRRCIETLRLVRSEDPTIVLPELEEIGSGRLAGRPFSELKSSEGDYLEAWFRGELRTPPGGEDINEFADRVSAGLEQLSRIDADWFAVAHMGVLHSAVAQLGLDAREFPNMGGLVFDEGAWRRWDRPLLPETPMRIGVGSDHNGRSLDAVVVSCLQANGYDVVKFSQDTEEVDYPEIAIEVATAVRYGHLDRAILICGTGIGMSIAANAVEGIRSTAVSDPHSAKRASRSNDVQVLCLGAEVLGAAIVPILLEEWLVGSLETTRSLRKVTQIETYDASTRKRLGNV